MAQQKNTPEKQRLEYEKLAFNKERGSTLAFHFFGVHKNKGHRRFEEGDDGEEEEEYPPEIQSNAHSPIPSTYQKYQSPSAQEYPYANHPPHGYSQDDSPNHAPSVDSQMNLSLEWSQGSAGPRSKYRMTQSPANCDSEMDFSAANITPGSSISKGDQWQTPNSAPSIFSNPQYDHNAPIQGGYNSAPHTKPNPKHVRIEMHSPKYYCWNGLCATNDPGTDENWINSRIVSRQGFRVERGKLIKTTNFNGQIFTSGATVMATWKVESHNITYQAEFRIIENGPFDVLFGRNLLSLPEIKYFRDDGIADTPILLEQSDISPQEQEAINRNRAAADARARELDQRAKPIRPSSGHLKNSGKIKESLAHKRSGM